MVHRLILTLNVRGPSYLGLTRSISWLLMPCLLTSPGHQQPWYWLCKIYKSWFYTRKDFNYLWHVVSVWRNDIKCKCMFMFPLTTLACKVLSLCHMAKWFVMFCVGNGLIPQTLYIMLPPFAAYTGGIWKSLWCIDLARNGNSGCANEILGCAKCHFWWKSPWKWKNLGNFRVCNWLPCLCKTQVHGWLAKTMLWCSHVSFKLI